MQHKLIKDADRVPQAEDAVIYARVSSKDQEREGFSIPAQLASLHEYASRQGFRVAREFVDVETAKQAGRTGFGEMISYLKDSRNRTVLLVEKTDRLYRNFRDLVTVDELGVAIHFVKENVVLSPESRSSEKFMHGIKVLVAKNYIDNLSEETRKGMLEKARQGIWPSYAPLGYTNILGPEGKRTIARDAEIAPAITRLFERYSTGKYSIRQIAASARMDGLAYRKSGDPVPTSTVHKILRNRIYGGDFDFDGVTYRGTHEPIVSMELWEQAQAILDGRGKKKTHRVKDLFAFSGLITCGHCGCALVGELKKGKYVYYHCTGHKGKCAEPYTREEILERKFTELLRGISFTEQVLTWVRRALKESHDDEKRFHDEAIQRLQREHRRIQDRIDTMYTDKLDGRIDAPFFDAKAAEWRNEQARVRKEMEAHNEASQIYLDEGIKLLELAQRAHKLFENRPPTEKRKLLDFVFSNCTWKGGELTALYRQPFDTLAVAVAAERAATAQVGATAPETGNWLPGMDSNHDSRLQRPLSYH
jgi:site-specific DNA recombinase